MRHHPCDQFAADILHVRDEIEKETGTRVYFKLQRIEEMVETIQSSRQMDIEHDELKGFLMNHYDFFNDVEWTAHERLLNRIFERRLAAQAA